MDLITYIYLVEGIDGVPNKVYIGKTMNPNRREYLHKKKYGKTIQYSIIDSIDSIMTIDWKPLEMFWIEQFRQWGFTMVNKNKGGGGPNFRTVEERERIRQSKIGKNHSNETKLKMSLSNSKPKPKGFGDKLKKPNSKPKNNNIPIIQLDLEGKYIAEWKSGTLASVVLNVNRGCISSCLTGKNKTAGGFKWIYKIDSITL